jgi:glycosyltransferase involved in cell wall biosynthesis
MGPLTSDDLPPPPPGKTGWPWTEQTAPPAEAPRADVGANGAAWPRVTIVVPSFNQGQYLEETLRSILLQAYPDLELIVVDGGSTDGSVDVIRKYERHVAWWVSERDKGQSHAINKGFARATGAIRGYLASDDLLEPGALQAVARAFGAGSPGAAKALKADWVVGHVRYREDGVGSWPLRADEENSFADWFLHCPIPQPGSFWSAELHNLAGEFREDLHYYFDYEFWLRLRFIHGRRPSVLDRQLAVYRLHPQSKTVANNAAFHVEGRMIRASYEPLLTGSQRAWLWLARRRHRARRYGSRGVACAMSRQPLRAARLLGTAVVLWPVILFDRHNLAAARQHFSARNSKNGPPMPHVWIDPDE